MTEPNLYRKEECTDLCEYVLFEDWQRTEAARVTAEEDARLAKESFRNAMILIAEIIAQFADTTDDQPFGAKWGIGDPVAKIRGSAWRGHVVGFYRTKATPIGYCVESAFEPGSVQVWPEAALADWTPTPSDWPHPDGFGGGLMGEG
jgi:dihydrofolate reductase (trimethoprim resistance protein)